MRFMAYSCRSPSEIAALMTLLTVLLLFTMQSRSCSWQKLLSKSSLSGSSKKGVEPKQLPLLPFSAGMMMISLCCYQPGNRLSVWEKGEKITRRKKRCKSNLSSVSVLADRSLHQDPMHSKCRRTTVPNVCLQALTLFLPPLRDFFTLSPNRKPAHRLRCYNDNRGALSCGVGLVLFRRCLQSRFLTSLRHLQMQYS